LTGAFPFASVVRNWQADRRCRCSRQIHWTRFATTIQCSPVSTTLPPLPDDPAMLQHLLRKAQAEITRLQMLIAVLLRNRFGRRSERLGEEALQRGIEDIEQSLAEQAAKIEAAQPATERVTKPPKRNRGSLPEHLPRVEVVVDIADKACGCCGAPLHMIGEDRSEMLDYVPAQLRVQVTRRPRGACPRLCARGFSHLVAASFRAPGLGGWHGISLYPA
jgi:hypothetical protein